MHPKDLIKKIAETGSAILLQQAKTND